MGKILIVVDMQNDFITGSLGTKEAQAIVPNVKKKIEEYKANGDEIIFTRDTHFDDYLETSEGKNLPVKHCIKDTHGWQVTDDIGNCVGCIAIDKETFGYSDWGDYDLDFDEEGNATKEIEVIGLCTDICVVSNALILKATYPEITITVDASCCAGVTPETHKAALTTMKSCQINVIGE